MENNINKSTLEELLGQPSGFNFIEYTYCSELKERNIILNDQVTPDVIERIVMQIIRFNREDEGKPVEDRKPITLYLHTGGGCVHSGLSVCDVIKTSKTPVHIEALGIAASMGALILMAGSHRKMYAHSALLIHNGSMQVQGTTTQVEDTVAFQKTIEAKVKDFILNNTKIPEKIYKKMYRNEWWLTAQQCLELGIIDEIIE